jgi:pyrroloquinoline quinone biosynthesis protein D
MSEKKQINVLNYLRLAIGVRLHWSEVRQQHWLLFPEGAIALNSTAVAILTLCDGHNSVYAIATALKRQFSDVKESDIERLLSQMMQRGLLSQYADRFGQVNLSARK